MNSVTAFINYFVARWNEKLRDEMFRNYLANAAKILTENTASLAGAKGVSVSRLTKTLSELTIQKEPQRPQKSGQEIASGIIERLAKKE